MVPDKLASRIDWLGHASFRVKGSRTIYIDPWKLESEPADGDLILITHSHYDHYSPEDIQKVAASGAVIIAPASTSDEISGESVVYLAPGESKTFGEIKVEAVPAYNTNKKFHPREKNWLGYIVEIDEMRVYHSGDSDLIEEMSTISCDVALVPVSGTYVMNADEAVEAVHEIGPKVAIPMHWGDIVGGRADADKFKVMAPCAVVIKEITP